MDANRDLAAIGIGHKRLSRLPMLMGVSAAAILLFVNEPASVNGADAIASAGVPRVKDARPAFAHRWTPAMVNDLLGEIDAAAGEGLDLSPYDADALRHQLVRTGGSDKLDAMADATAFRLARDYLLGRVIDRSGFDWHIERGEGDADQLAVALRRAVDKGALRPWLRSLLPSDPRYAVLRDALAVTPASDADTRNRLIANMERWRWMPRDLGRDHIYVNVPSYTLDLVRDGREVSTHSVVVGARGTPTPQMTMAASSVVMNPYWYVPASIVRSSRLRPGRAGYEFVAAGGGRHIVRQRPGPRNALGRIKIDMPNAHAIYLHDTPAKGHFDKPSRAYSHGCIRVKDIDRLALQLVEMDSGDATAIERGLAGRATRTVKLSTARPVWLVYFTADTGPDGELVTLEDPYDRDARLIARLNGPTQIASR